MKKYFVFVLLSICLVFMGCQKVPDDAKHVQSEIAQKAANTIKFTGNAEIENITKRLQLTSDPGLIGYVVLLNESGQPILYTTVKGKVTSGAKRLTKPYEWITGNTIGGGVYVVYVVYAIYTVYGGAQ